MGHPGHKKEHLAQQVKRHLSEILLRGLRDPRIGFVTITGVEMSGDLKVARVFTSVLGDAGRAAEAIEALQRARRYLERELFRAIRRRAPVELRFELDDSADRASRIDEILMSLDRPNQTEEPDT